MTFRLHIDIPISENEHLAAETALAIMERFRDPQFIRFLYERGVTDVNYRLGNDEDRQRSNYLQKTPQGHVTNKKDRLKISNEEYQA